MLNTAIEEALGSVAPDEATSLDDGTPNDIFFQGLEAQSFCRK